jgi:hypothetical protein
MFGWFSLEALPATALFPMEDNIRELINSLFIRLDLKVTHGQIYR